LNKEPNVRPATRERVLAAAAALDYSPNISARSLAGDRSYLLALLYDDPSLNYLAQVQIGALAKCREEGFYLLVEPCRCGVPGVTRAVRSLLVRSRVDGVILTPPVCDSPAVMTTLEEAGVAYVRIAPARAPHRAPSVAMDDYQAGYDMTAYLIALGHRRIAFIRGAPAHGAASRRYDGFRAALAAAKIALPDGFVAQGDFSFDAGMDCGLALLRRRRRPTAIFAANDDMAAGIIAAAHRLGVAIPEALSVAGFDDTAARLAWPAVTTVRQPITAMAEAAAGLLIAALRTRERAEKATPPRLMLDYEIIHRASTAPPPADGAQE
jgi:LacI family transcriptional regulator